jgi:hypothetical protein
MPFEAPLRPSVPRVIVWRNGAGEELRFLRHPCFEGGIDVGADGGPLALAILIEVEAIDTAVQLRVATVDALIAGVALLVGDADVEGDARDRSRLHWLIS